MASRKNGMNIVAGSTKRKSTEHSLHILPAMINTMRIISRTVRKKNENEMISNAVDCLLSPRLAFVKMSTTDELCKAQNMIKDF